MKIVRLFMVGVLIAGISGCGKPNDDKQDKKEEVVQDLDIQPDTSN